jgi:N-acetylneuraminic acid mutarotase
MRRHLNILLLLLLLGVTLATVATFADESSSPVMVASSLAAPAYSWQRLHAERVPDSPDIVLAAADTCAAATLLTIDEVGTGEQTVVTNMTHEDSDPVLSCMWGTPDRDNGYRTVWYQFTAPENGRVFINTVNNFNPNRYDTVLAVHTGSCGSLIEVACNDDYQGFQSRVSFTVTKDTVYNVEIADWNGGTPAAAELDIFLLINPLQSRWESLPASAPGRTRQATVTIGNRIYMVGGQTNGTLGGGTPVLSNDLHRYNVVTGSWVELAEMPGIGLTNVTAAYINGKIYVPGGDDNTPDAFSNNHYAYDISSNTWEILTDTLAAVGWSQAVARPGEDQYYLIGGLSSKPAFTSTAQVTSTTWLYDVSAATWLTGVSMNVPRYGHTAVWINDGICVIGGINHNNEILSDGECYQPLGSMWVSLGSPLNTPRYGAASAVSPDGKWYVIGGNDGSHNAVATVEVYDSNNPGLGWVELDVPFDLGGTEAIRARSFPEAEFVDSFLYAVGGNSDQSTGNPGADLQVMPLVQRLFAPAHLIQLPIVIKSGDEVFDDNFTVARPLKLNKAQREDFSSGIDFFDTYYFELSATTLVDIRLNQIPAGSNYDIAIYDDNKFLLREGDNAGTLEELETLNLSAGRYYIVVERISGLPTGADYRLIVED